MNIVIVMSTYNGSAYLRDQVKSIQEQTFSAWKLVIRDDGSSDNTIEIIQDLVRSDKRITLLDGPPQNRGPTQSFNILVNHAMKSSPDYLMFTDQDDYWESGKIEETLKLMLKAETDCPRDTPVLVHTDLLVADSQLNPISNSYLKYQHMRDAGNRALKVLLSQNYITGCTMMVNRALISIAQPIPESAIMHDWWYGLCAATTGKIAFIATPTIKYRQHSANVYGSSGFTNMLFSLKKLGKYLARKKSNYLSSYLQDCALQKRITNTKYSNSQNFDTLDKYCTIHNGSGILRCMKATKLGVYQQGLLRNLFFFYSLLFTKPAKTDSHNAD